MNKSPSKIKTARLCGRKFYGVYVEKWDTGPKPAADLGTDVHALLEHYLGSGELPSKDVLSEWQQDDRDRAIQIAQAAIPHIPQPPVPEIELEGWARIKLPDDTMMLGRVDVWEPAARRVTDFKTTSDFRYSLSAEQLRVDPQVITYAYSRLGDGDSITVRFLYLRTRAPHYTKEVEVRFTRAELEDAWTNLVDTDVALINKILSAESFADVEPTESACSAFGGCPFRVKCAALGHNSMGVMSSLFMDKDRKKEPKKMELKRRVKITDKTPVKAEEKVEEKVEVKDEEKTEQSWFDEATSEDTGKDQAIASTDINPPKEEIPTPAPGEIEEYDEPLVPVSKWTKPQLVKWLGHHVPGYFADLPAPRHRVPQLREDVETLREQRRVVAAGGKVEPPKPVETPEELVALVDPGRSLETVKTPEKKEPKEQPRKTSKKERSKGAGYTLYINCAPAGPYKRLEQILEPMCVEVDQARAKNEGDPGHYLTIPYGQGPARVAALLLGARASLKGAIVVDRRTPVAPSAIEVLAPRAVQIITGF